MAFRKAAALRCAVHSNRAVSRLSDVFPMSEPCVIVRLGGGLGNQLFIYAFVLAVAERNRVPLKLDLSGFARDHTYKRKYLLKHLFPNLLEASRWENRMFPLGHTLRKIERKLNARRPLAERRFVQEKCCALIRSFAISG